ncbi:MAG TPA: hypothetical protein VME43_08305 [Bryobacteraceae bacterium]|nr:hypothetical protein [Bryobacteraceae bacterium]
MRWFGKPGKSGIRGWRTAAIVGAILMLAASQSAQALPGWSVNRATAAPVSNFKLPFADTDSRAASPETLSFLVIGAGLVVAAGGARRVRRWRTGRKQQQN